MQRPAPISDLERAELRRLYLASGPGTWEAVTLSIGQAHLYRIAPDGKRWLLCMPNRGEDADLAAAARNSLPRLFAEIDELRRRARPAIRVEGSVG